MNLTRWLGIDPIIFAAFALATFGLLVVAGWQIGAEDDPIRPRVFRGDIVTDDARVADSAGTISEADGDRVVIQDAAGPTPVSLAAGAIIQTLSPEEVADVEPGDWVLVGGIDDNVNAYIVQGIVVVSDDQVLR